MKAMAQNEKQAVKDVLRACTMLVIFIGRTIKNGGETNFNTAGEAADAIVDTVDQLLTVRDAK